MPKRDGTMTDFERGYAQGNRWTKAQLNLMQEIEDAAQGINPVSRRTSVKIQQILAAVAALRQSRRE